MFQRRSGQMLAQPITLVLGNVLEAKFLPARGEPLPDSIATAPFTTARVEGVDNRVGANFSIFTIRAVGLGSASLTAAAAGRRLAGPLGINVVGRIDLPAANTNAGLLARLLLAESRTPITARPNAGDLDEGMVLMRVVVENRLARPDARWASAGARSLVGVVRAPNQFEGFHAYPALSVDVDDQIAGVLALANDGANGNFSRMRAHVLRAIEIASQPSVADPSRGRLFWWRSAGASPPGTGITEYRTIQGNQFWINN